MNHQIFLNTISMFAFITILSNCRTREEPSGNLKHIAGQLNRPNMLKLESENCPQESVYTGRKEVLTYIRKIFKTITDASPDVFQGAYAPERFCITNSGDDIMNAFAYPNGMLVFFDKLTLAAPNDAAIAALIGHEAGHVLMQHGALRLNSPVGSTVDHPFLDTNTEWNDFKGKFITEDKQLADRISEARKRLQETSKKRDVFISPFRRLLSPATRELEKGGQEAVNSAKASLEQVNREISRIEAELRKLEESAQFKNLADSTRISIKNYFQARIEAARDSMPLFQYLISQAERRLSDIDNLVDTEIGNQLSRQLGGILGGKWKDVRDEHKRSKEDLQSLESQIDVNSKTLMDKASSILGYNYSRYNWMEAEADQVGLELTIKAGYYKDSGVDLSRILVSFGGQSDVDKCEQMLANLRNGTSTDLPPRGDESHPTSCWRMLNVGYTEQKLHESHFAQWINSANTTNKFPGELEQLKKK